MYLSDLEDNGFIAYHKEDGAYRTTYKGMIERTYNHTLAIWKRIEVTTSMNFTIEN